MTRAPRAVATIHLKPTAGVLDVPHILDTDADDGESVFVTTMCGAELPRDAIETTVARPHLPCVDALDAIRREADPFAEQPPIWLF